MLKNKSPLKVDLIVFTVCCLLASWYAGYLYGSAQTPVCDKPVAKKLSIDMTKMQQKRMAKYLATRGM